MEIKLDKLNRVLLVVDSRVVGQAPLPRRRVPGVLVTFEHQADQNLGHEHHPRRVEIVLAVIVRERSFVGEVGSHAVLGTDALPVSSPIKPVLADVLHCFWRSSVEEKCWLDFLAVSSVESRQLFFFVLEQLPQKRVLDSVYLWDITKIIFMHSTYTYNINIVVETNAKLDL